ncbi:TPA: CoA-disulfide reductase [Staphylococcus aureus]|nr:CoA-disulfide reductase [Staphylococcus aureus]
MPKIVVVGAVAGGATCASQIRRLDKESDIIIFEKDRDMSFANCALPYVIGEVVEDRKYALAYTPEKFYDRKQITVKTYHEVIAINDERQTVTVLNRKTNEQFEESYDKLILSPGASANSLGFESDITFTLRNLEDTDAIDQFIKANQVDKVLVVGAGYVSLEVLENLYERGLHPTLIHRSDKINKLMDADMNQPILDELDKREIPYRLNEEIDAINGNEITFKSGKVEHYDMIIEGVGTHPNSKFIESSNIKLDRKGFIPVNDKFETNVPNIYAIGDIATSHYRHVDLPASVPLAWGAHRAASIVAEQIAGNDTIEFKGFLGNNIVKFFDYTFASVGVKPNELKQFDYKMVEVTQGAHANYYPGNSPLHLRVYYDTSNRQILRAAAVGKEGADKRIDVLSMAMMNHLTVDELTEFEVAYAGYGSEQNYMAIIDDFNKTPLITYGMFIKDKTRKFKSDIFNTQNWKYDELNDEFICPNNKRIGFKRYAYRNDRYGFKRDFKLYECDDCSACSLRQQCIKPNSKSNKKIMKNYNWEYFKAQINQKLSEPKTKKIYSQRKIDVEPVFGFMKAILGFTRMSVRGINKVKRELGFVLMALNIRKIAAQRAVHYQIHLKKADFYQIINRNQLFYIA